MKLITSIKTRINRRKAIRHFEAVREMHQRWDNEDVKTIHAIREVKRTVTTARDAIEELEDYLVASNFATQTLQLNAN